MSLPSDNSAASEGPPNASSTTNGSTITNKNGWDGKLRVGKRAGVINAEISSDPEYSDEDAPPAEQIQADEDLLEDYEEDTDNQISHIEFPVNIASSLQDLDLYDNLISHMRGLDHLVQLTSLDLSFNKIKHIKNVDHLKELRDIYFVQNKIQKIENLEGLEKLRNLELAANRIREVENLNTLTGLEELWLGKNKITELKNVSALVNLKILSIQSNRLSAITGLDSLLNLEELYISHNALTHISGLDQNRKLRVLDISSNQISQLTNLKHLEHLEELWASSNLLSSFDEVEEELVNKKELNTVYFEGNPLQTRSPALYRNKVRLALPQIKQIDASTYSLHAQFPVFADNASASTHICPAFVRVT
ncbi:MAG: hypothetical protein Q9166_002392 [cf. Caloplaca sp. 2 TL-2023]